MSINDIYNFLLPYAKFYHLSIAVINDQYQPNEQAVYLVEKGGKALEYTIKDVDNFLTDNVDYDTFVKDCTHNKYSYVDDDPIAVNDINMFAFGTYFNNLLKTLSFTF